MSEISVANGWQQILTEALAEARGLPPEWCFEIVKAVTVDGALKISATYVSGDVPLDDHLPSDRKIPHPWRAMMRIREEAREKSLGTCECCGRPGRLFNTDEEARVRCRLHEYVLDAVAWGASASSTGYMFDNPEAAMARFLKEYGDGLDMMQELLARQGRYKHDPLDGSE